MINEIEELIEEDGPRSIPKNVWAKRWDDVFSQPRSQKLVPTFRQIILNIPLFLRYVVYYVKKKWFGFTPLMDYVHPAQSDHQTGIPLGGIGGGTINFSYLAGFGNFQMKPGMYEAGVVDAWQFIINIRDSFNKTVYQQVLNPRKAPSHRKLSSWKWEFPKDKGEFRALYPRAWLILDIPEHGIKLICRINNPIMPMNYKDSCLPGCIFEWSVYNSSPDAKNVSIIWTLKSGTGSSNDGGGSASCSSFTWGIGSEAIDGLEITQHIHGMKTQYCVSTPKETNHSVTMCTYFDPLGDGNDVWQPLLAHGEFPQNLRKPYQTSGKNELGAAICVHTSVMPKSCDNIALSLSWHMPIVKFRDDTIHHRYYTTLFNDLTQAGKDISLNLLKNYRLWESIVFEWQNTILTRSDMPEWTKQALFNELYYVADGGTLWVQAKDSENLPDNDPRKKFGHFAYLEGHEYRMYNTYDVHFYASFALISHWPVLQMCLQYDIRDGIRSQDLSEVWFLYNGEIAPRKVKNTVPHDIGDPDEQPFDLINAYPIHDVSQWKDLNLKFVLQVYRDYIYSKSKNYLCDMYPEVHIVMKHALTWDVDGDGMIENSGSPDQTYDAWVMTGTSAYCGGLWLAAVAVFIRMSLEVGEIDVAERFTQILSAAQKSYDLKLWNGEYYNFDCSDGTHSRTIMADQLCGLWYLRCSGFQDEILPQEKTKSALKCIFKNNVLKYFHGNQGAVNGMQSGGTVDRYAIQSEEMWTGVSYALASLLIYEGLSDEGFQTARGVYDTVFNKAGLAFATPEALHGQDSYRSLAYMRPLSIWSIKTALDFVASQSNEQNSRV